jgi:5-methyltetrahydrofolate--homocysteine methyltransferase
VKKDWDRDEVFSFINETALFKNHWQLKTASATDYIRLVEEKYRPVFEALKAEVKREGWFESKVVYGYFPCQADGNDVVVYDPEKPA